MGFRTSCDVASRFLLTLNDGQEDDDDEEEERDVEDHAIELGFVPRRVFDLVADPTAGTDPHVHVEQVTLNTHTHTHTEPVSCLTVESSHSMVIMCCFGMATHTRNPAPFALTFSEIQKSLVYSY